jgi:hypothetical protein
MWGAKAPSSVQIDGWNYYSQISRRLSGLCRLEIVKYCWPKHFLPFYLATWLWSPTYTSSVAVLLTTICQAAHRNLLSLSWFHHPQEGWSMLQQQLCCRCPHPVLPRPTDSQWWGFTQVCLALALLETGHRRLTDLPCQGVPNEE